MHCNAHCLFRGVVFNEELHELRRMATTEGDLSDEEMAQRLSEE